MKITEEYIEDLIKQEEKNLEFAKKEGWENLALESQGALHILHRIRFHKRMSGKMCLLSKTRKKLKYRILLWVENKLRGVE